MMSTKKSVPCREDSRGTRETADGRTTARQTCVLCVDVDSGRRRCWKGHKSEAGGGKVDAADCVVCGVRLVRGWLMAGCLLA
jgi:hypothetical protein